MKELQASSYLSGGNASYIEELYETYLKNPNAVSQEWRDFFLSLPRVNGSAGMDISHADIRDHFLKLAKHPKTQVTMSTDVQQERKQQSVEALIDAFRKYGHLAAKLDPLGTRQPEVSELQLNQYNLSRTDENSVFYAEALMGMPSATLKDIHAKLKQIYCDKVGVEYMTIRNPAEIKWLQQRLEHDLPQMQLSLDAKKNILKLLTAADGLERYLGTRYVGQKRFSLEGGDSLIPLLHEIINDSVEQGAHDIVIGMAHRGRLNVLLNVIGQAPEELFQEFEGKKNYGLTSGDVKYHLGFSSDVKTAHGLVHLSLAFNPSHLEVISAVVMGSVRARQDRHQNTDYAKVVPIIIHGDASFAGQGIVMETLNMSQTRAYGIGGSVHIVINNQVGFTTSDPHDARSSLYCTDIAKMIESPVFHVNADDPEAVVKVAKLAIDYRNQFYKDVVIDLVCYRRHGHNEADEPSATQPIMYQKIKDHPTPREIYGNKLLEEKVISQEAVDAFVHEYRDALDQGRQIVVSVQSNPARETINWSQYIGKEWNVIVDTTFNKNRLKELAHLLLRLPEGFELQRQVGLMMESRAKMADGELPIDWGFAETMAYATLIDQNYSVRFSGQDSRRGTFGHRQSVLHDQKTGDTYTPLHHVGKEAALFQIYDSLLSEVGALGFEYGYAKTNPYGLVIWEAQFGDFGNGAQVVIDQFLSSGEQKWKQLCGLVMLLPHGYEGMGPEHSSARLERYLQLCAQHNMQVCVPSTPAQMFHMLRRQVLRPFRKPLIVMTPKSLLRHKLAISILEDLAAGKFQLIIPEVDQDINTNKVRKVILCSGKVYYDLLIQRRENQQKDIAIVRVEQLYPFPSDEVKTELAKYKKAKSIVWCQEEPQNQGAWNIIRDRITELLSDGQTLSYAGRPASASPAAGYPALHKKQQIDFVNEALL